MTTTELTEIKAAAQRIHAAAVAAGVDLRRHVQLKMRYNEAKGRRA